MLDILQTIVVTVFTLAILVSIHEFGHFWVARRCGIKVLRFSIGFGKPLCSWRDKSGTEYVIAGIPLGGYVKMLDEREAPVAEEERQFAFNNKPVSARLATVAAGPLANFILAIVAYWFVFISGVVGVVPIVGSVTDGSPAAQAQLKPGQEIIAVDDQLTPTWEALHLALLGRIGETGTIHIRVKDESGNESVAQARITAWMSGDEVSDLMAGLGIELYRPPVLAVFDSVQPDSPAALAGLQAGDKVVEANGETIADWKAWVDFVRPRPEQAINTVFERNGQRMTVTLTPRSVTDENGEIIGQVGVTPVVDWPEELQRSYHYGPWDATVAAAERTWSMSVFTLDSIKKMLVGVISPKNLSGPITIAKVASASAQSGLEAYISFLALLSVSLGVINLLPIPVLDGGHILYGLVELVTRHPVSERIQMLGYQLGLFIILGVMMFAIYNDITRL